MGTVEFLKRTIHKIEDSDKWIDNNEMFCYSVSGKFDSAQTEASESWNLAYRDIFYCNDNTDNENMISWRLCISEYAREMAMQQSIHFIIIDNDTNKVINRVRKVFRDSDNFDIMTKPECLKNN